MKRNHTLAASRDFPLSDSSLDLDETPDSSSPSKGRRGHSYKVTSDQQREYFIDQVEVQKKSIRKVKIFL